LRKRKAPDPLPPRPGPCHVRGSIVCSLVFIEYMYYYHLMSTPVTRKRIAALHLASVIRRVIALWVAAIVIAAVMLIAARFGNWQVAGGCWLLLAVLSAYAVRFLARLR
jgi:hypothetical protein